MDYKEFQKTMLETQQWELFYSVARIMGNVPDGEDIHHMCLLCDYRTPGVNAEEMHKIDDLMAEHVWKKHRSEAKEAVREYWEAPGA